MVARRLSAKPNLAASLAGLRNHPRDHPLDRLILFVEEISKLAGIAVHTEGQLGQIVGANGEAVEMLRKFSSQDDIGWNLAHDIHLQAVFTALQPVFSHDFQHFYRLTNRTAEGNHDDSVCKAHLFT